VKIAILSDIHSNIDALEAVAKDAKEWGACQWLVVGDIVGYGAAPSECIDLLKNLGASSIAGNHDWGVIEKTSIDYFNFAARQAVLWTREQLGPSARSYLESLPLTLTFEDIDLAHANFTQPEGWDYVFTITRAAQELSAFKSRIGVIGHSHVPFIVKASSEGEWPEQIMGERVVWDEHSRFLVNAGSVGQPRDGDPRACYLRVDCSSREIAFRRVTYDVAEAQRRISQAGLPSSLAERLPLGR